MIMDNNIVKEQVSENGKYKVTVYYDTDAQNPRYEWDFPMHCEDWGRHGSLMTKDERENGCSSRRALLEGLVSQYGDNKKAITMLRENYNGRAHSPYENAMSYDRSRKEWIIWEWLPESDIFGRDEGWHEVWSFDDRIDDVCIFDFIEYMDEETIIDMANDCMTDKVKLMSYNFGYYGGVTFDNDIYSEADGIAWIEKDEAVGDGKWFNEETWDKYDCCQLCKPLMDAIDAWTKGDVYRFVTQERIDWHVYKSCDDDDVDDMEYDETEWEVIDSCGGFYGDVDAVIEEAMPVIEEAMPNAA